MRRSQSLLLPATQFLDLVPRHAGQRRSRRRRRRRWKPRGVMGGGRGEMTKEGGREDMGECNEEVKMKGRLEHSLRRERKCKRCSERR